MRSGRHTQRGLTYLALLIAVSILGVWLGCVGTMWAVEARREKEQALLDTGRAYRSAIRSYFLNSPGMIKRFPPDISDLLLDSRYLTVRRHLRKPYADPFSQQWGLIYAPDGGIMGVYSRSTGLPLKKGGFLLEELGFESAQRYGDWKFIYDPVSADVVPVRSSTIKEHRRFD